MHALAFRNTEFEIIDRSNQPWLRSFQIGSALGYKNPSADMSKLYDRNAEEFTDKMTAVVELPTKGGIQQVRIFSLRGAHLLAMLSRTAVAKEFRRWVLDILEGISEASNEPRHSPTLLGTTIGTDGFRCLGAVLDGKLNKLPAKAKQRAKMHVWSQVHKAFSVVSAQDIPAEQLDSARNFIAAYTLEGEWLAAEQVNPIARLDINYPASWLPEHNPHAYRFGYRSGGQDPYIHMIAKNLCGMDSRSPSLALLGQLNRAGYDVDACRLEVMAMRHHLEMYDQLLHTLRDGLENSGITFKLSRAAQAMR
ncbi:Bro-N domain-containing protein [uncultured Pseudomonas sp.]|uniref:BRO-N domain-containing protein n=1 Tax=uncultured Pseudomonas sp. TaxID=114707 RepID=UPI0030D6D307|tara:strand:- start:50703 stop:51626 length:924 start_codon:yes stop_codon:yes gene_type:complete